MCFFPDVLMPDPQPYRISLADCLMSRDVLIFDLDNTLYPASSRLFDQVDARMSLFVRDLLGLPLDAARKLQKSAVKG